MIEKIRYRLKSVIRNTSVEPIIFFSTLGMNIFNFANQVGAVSLFCEKYFVNEGKSIIENGVKIDCWSPNFGLDHNQSIAINLTSIEIKLQQDAASWWAWFGFAYSIPCIFSDIFMGAYSDKQGRKYNILIGIAGESVAIASWIIIFAWPATVSMYVPFMGFFLGGMTGYVSIIFLSSTAYLRDTVTDKSELRARITWLEIYRSVALIISPLIAKELLSVISYSATITVSLGFEILVLAITVVTLKQVPPEKMQEIIQRRRANLKIESGKGEIENTTEPSKFTKKLKVAFLDAVALLKAVRLTFTKNREGHRRLYLYILSLTYLINIVCDALVEGITFNLFVQMAPFRWDKNQISNFRSISNSIHLVGAFVGVFLLRKRFAVSDTLIMILALTSTALRCLITAVSTESWTLYLGTVIGFFYRLMNPGAYSFTAKIVDADECGKAYSAFSIGMNLALFSNNAIFSSIYCATVATFPGFVFLVGAFFLFCMVCLIGWVHIDFHDYYSFFRRKRVITVKL